jgi:dihydroorotase-like cyclic amidohydrolase
MTIFHSLYDKALQPKMTIAKLGAMLEGSWTWQFHWKTALSHFEAAELAELLLLLDDVGPILDMHNSMK